MKTRVALVVGMAILLVALVAGAVILAVQHRTQATGPVYTVGQVEAGLTRDPARWVGRSIQLRAVLLPLVVLCTPGSTAICARTYFPADSSFALWQPALLIHPVTDPLLGPVRRIPWLGRLLPAPQPIPGQGVYRVTIQVAPAHAFCPRRPCYWAVLPDAAPAPTTSGRPLGLGR